MYAPLWKFTRYWATVEITDPDGRGVMFYPRERRTWALYIKGYPVVVIQGKVVKR